MTKPSQGSPVDRLLALMARLRDPERGCPWDLEQDFATIAPHTIEEAYEVADAIDRQDMPALRDELGDLLFQVVFYAQMARERGAFDFDAGIRPGWQVLAAGLAVVVIDAVMGRWKRRPARTPAVAAE